MPAPGKYPDELWERATRMAVQARRPPASMSTVFAPIPGPGDRRLGPGYLRWSRSTLGEEDSSPRSRFEREHSPEPSGSESGVAGVVGRRWSRAGPRPRITVLLHHLAVISPSDRGVRPPDHAARSARRFLER